MGTNFSWGNDEIRLDIKPLEEKIQNNTNDINTLKTNKLDVSSFNAYKITNDNKLNNVINELNNSTLINYQGEWVGGTALLGQVWSYNNEMWLCKVSSTTNTPSDGNDWDLLSAPEIDLSNYYDKTEINDTLSNKQNILRLSTQPRNVSITDFSFTGNYLDNAPIYEGVLEFKGQGEANLVNNCTLLLGAYLYDITQNKFISAESVNLRVQNNYQIRASLPSDTRQYRLYFVGTKKG